MLRHLILSLLLLACAVPAAVGSQKSDKMKPRWMTSSLPEPKSPGYIFITAQGSGTSLEEARERALVNLIEKLEHERGLVINSNLKLNKFTSRTSSTRNSSTDSQFQLEVTELGKEITITGREVDEYWEESRGNYLLTALYTVNDNNRPGEGSYNDDISLTTSYGITPVACSLIPGVGQFVKGSTLKGALFLGATAVGATAIILCENQRADYAKKMKEKPQHIDFYRNKKSSWETGRNVAIGVTAAVYIWNLVDAAAAPGRRRVTVDRRRYNYSLAPTVFTDGGAGASFAMTF